MSILEEAARRVVPERQKNYGHPYDDFTRATGMLSALGYCFQSADGTLRKLNAADQPIIMACVKLSREVHQHQPDNLGDICGYMRCLEMVHAREEGAKVKNNVIPNEEPPISVCSADL